MNEVLFLGKCDLCQRPKERGQVSCCNHSSYAVGYVCHDCYTIPTFYEPMKRIEFFKSLLCAPAALLGKSESKEDGEFPVKLLKCQTQRGRPIAVFYLKGIDKPDVYYFVFPYDNKTYELKKEWCDMPNVNNCPFEMDSGWVYYEGDHEDLKYGPATDYVRELFPSVRIIEIQAYRHWEFMKVKKNRETT